MDICGLITRTDSGYHRQVSALPGTGHRRECPDVADFRPLGMSEGAVTPRMSKIDPKADIREHSYAGFRGHFFREYRDGQSTI
jgi:hypothetical protein